MTPEISVKTLKENKKVATILKFEQWLSADPTQGRDELADFLDLHLQRMAPKGYEESWIGSMSAFDALLRKIQKELGLPNFWFDDPRFTDFNFRPFLQKLFVALEVENFLSSSGTEGGKLFDKIRKKAKTPEEQKVIDLFLDFAYQDSVKLTTQASLSRQYESIEGCLSSKNITRFSLLDALRDQEKGEANLIYYLKNNVSQLLQQEVFPTFRAMDIDWSKNFLTPTTTPIPLYRIYNVVEKTVYQVFSSFLTKQEFEQLEKGLKDRSVIYPKVKKILVNSEKDLSGLITEITKELVENKKFGLFSLLEEAEDNEGFELDSVVDAEKTGKKTSKTKNSEGREESFKSKTSVSVVVRLENFPVNIKLFSTNLFLLCPSTYFQEMKKYTRYTNRVFGVKPLTPKFLDHVITPNTVLKDESTTSAKKFILLEKKTEEGLESLCEKKYYFNGTFLLTLLDEISNNRVFDITEVGKIDPIFAKIVQEDNSLKNLNKIDPNTAQLDEKFEFLVSTTSSKRLPPFVYALNPDTRKKIFEWVETYVKEVCRELGPEKLKQFMARRLYYKDRLGKLDPKTRKFYLTNPQDIFIEWAKKKITKDLSSGLSIRAAYESYLFFAAICFRHGFTYLHFIKDPDYRGRLYTKSLLSPSGSNLPRAMFLPNLETKALPIKKLNFDDLISELLKSGELVETSLLTDLRNNTKLKQQVEKYDYIGIYVFCIATLVSKEKISTLQRAIEIFEQNFTRLLLLDFSLFGGNQADDVSKPLLLLPFCFELINNFLRVDGDLEKFFESYQTRCFIYLDASASGFQNYANILRDSELGVKTNLISGLD